MNRRAETARSGVAGTLAGGVSSPVRSGSGVGARLPSIVAARGARVYDVAGREYIDYVCAYGPILLGHADPRISVALRRALEDGTVTGATHPEELRLADRVRAFLPSMERVRFVSTGTEACMSAIRVARAFTRRPKFVRFEGNYHGHADEMIFSAGASSASQPTLECGITQAAMRHAFVLSYNDLERLETILAHDSRDVAAVVVEPVAANMGLVMPSDGFLAGLRALCDRWGIVLIFDEVITGFRVGPGGAQARLGVRPDMTCVGKALGGGLPIAAYGGRADIMGLLAPAGPVFQGGTFSGNPLCVAAAHAFLDALQSDPDFHDRLERLARGLASGVRAALAEVGLAYPVVQHSSIVDFMFREGPPHQNLAQAREADAAAYARYFWAALARGISLPPSQMEVMFLTGAHNQADIDATVAVMGEALAAIRVAHAR